MSFVTIDLMERHEKLIGTGNHKKVYEHTDSPDEKVRIVYREQIENDRLKSAYYLNKIAHILMPENFPDIHLVDNRGEESEIIAERLPHDEYHAHANKLSIEDDDYLQGLTMQSVISKEDADFIYSEVWDKEDNPHIKDFVNKAYENGLSVDSGGQNFSLTEDNVPKYMDINPAWQVINDKVRLSFDESKLREAIQKLPEAQKKKCLSYLKRIKVLFEEWKSANDG